MKLAQCAVLLVLGAAAMVSAVDWVEPAFVEEAATAKLRGVSHTVSPHHGMVTYISPARRVQTSGFVYTPPLPVSVIAAHLPQPVPPPPVHETVVMQPVIVNGGLANAYDVLSGAVPTQVEQRLEYAHRRAFGSHVHHGVDAEAHVDQFVGARHHHRHHHAHVHGHHHHLPPHIDIHETHPRHHHHSRYHPVFPYHADLHVPAELYRTAYHQPHYGHRSPISYGNIAVPHDSHGAIAVEEPAFTGYNPGPPLRHHSHHRRVVEVSPAVDVQVTVPRVHRTYGRKHH